MAKTYRVKNRSAGRVVYKIPDANIRREFQPGEEKIISYNELEKLTMQPGGRPLMEEYLMISAEEVLESLNIHAEPEYHLTEQQIVDLIKNGTEDEWLDMLDFAPDGVLDLVKEFSVKIPLNDVRKREALLKKTGFSVDAALASVEPEKEEAPAKKPTRRTNKTTAATSGRRTSGDKYKEEAKKEAAKK